ncbi:MAG: hypothetical protein CVV27_16575 [Candidatus Melainabacteria bacterium HGW-Melainabacteria-1]|nr:MAG: hypothetical protein CVV27_16575 [Candidatus Melainabacteria bacterium HGW-Melainabacteria-1]
MSAQSLARLSAQRQSWISRLPALVRKLPLHLRLADQAEFSPQSEYLFEGDLAPDSECLNLLTEVHQEVSQAQTLAELKSLLPGLEAEGASAVAAAVLYHLLSRLEALDPRQLQRSSQGFAAAALEGPLPLAELESLFARGFALYAHSRPCLAAESLASYRAEVLEAGLDGSRAFLAALMAQACRQPVQLQQMIAPCDDPALFAIRFPGQAAVITSQPSAAERLIYAHAGAEGFWPVLLEKASLCLLSGFDADSGPAPMLQAALELLSGQSAETFDTSMLPMTVLRQTLSEAFAANQLVIVAANQYPWKRSDTDRHPAESYALIGYEPHTDRVTLRRAIGQSLPCDAQGQELACEGELMSLPLQDVPTYFSHLALA